MQTLSTDLQNHSRTLAGAASEAIRDQILGWRYPPGTRIDQSDLARQLGISLVPLREALRKLAAEGLVQIVPHRGAFVCQVSRDELKDLYGVRIILEGIATRLAVPRLTDECIARLTGLLSKMEHETPKEQCAELLLLNREFHFTVYRASGRPFLCELIAGLWEKSERYRAFYVHLPGRSLQALKEHKEVLQALRCRQANKAVRAVRNDIRQTMTELLSVFENGHEIEANASDSLRALKGPETQSPQ
ncbi:MAG: GntR family transcriptional regulator [Candidatus Sulfotelmatobacter sp.]